MELPKRTEQHEIDTKGMNLLTYVLPEEYIFRTLGERDYGIDGLIEMAFGGQVSGIFISAQLKSSRHIHWTSEGATRISIMKTTCNYWFQNNMPVLLLLSDIVEQKVYYCDVKSQIRKRYREYIENDSFSFVLFKKNELHFPVQMTIQSDEDYLSVYGYQIRFMAMILRMIQHSSFEEVLKLFITNWKNYFEHLKHQNADPFLVQSMEFYDQTIYIHNCLLQISNVLNLGMKKVDFQSIRQDLQEMYTQFGAIPEYEILEYEITVIHSEIEEYIEKVISGIKEYILNTEGDFWRINNPFIYQEVQNMDWNI
mgnify:CR=1 FL=1